jgi:hypothetical protein
MLQTFAHLSDLHLGVGPAAVESARRLCSALLSLGIHRVFVTGDITHGGRRSELSGAPRPPAPAVGHRGWHGPHLQRRVQHRLQAGRLFAAARGALVHEPRWLDARPRSFVGRLVFSAAGSP